MRRAIIAGSVVLLIVSVAGFITSLMLNTFVFDKCDAYGEVPIPDLGVTITPPPGVAEPQLTEDEGSTTTVNNDARRRV